MPRPMTHLLLAAAVLMLQLPHPRRQADILLRPQQQRHTEPPRLSRKKNPRCAPSPFRHHAEFCAKYLSRAPYSE